MEHRLKRTVLKLLQSDLNHYNQAWELDEDTSVIMSGVQAGDLIDWEKAEALVEKLEDARAVVYELVGETFRSGGELHDQGDTITAKAAEIAGLDGKHSDLLWATFEEAVEYQKELV